MKIYETYLQMKTTDSQVFRLSVNLQIRAESALLAKIP